MRSINISTTIPTSRKLDLQLPKDVPVGPAEVVVTVADTPDQGAGTLGDFVRSPLCGIWKEREDISDGVEFAHRLRQQAQERRHG